MAAPRRAHAIAAHLCGDPPHTVPALSPSSSSTSSSIGGGSDETTHGLSVQSTAAVEYRHGGDLVGMCLSAFRVKFVFCLSGGHISPVLVGCKKYGIRVVDVRHEVNAVFAADAVSRSSDSIGVAVVTAGPGLTNTITAVKNAQMAASPIILLGGATVTLLKGRGALQDIDQQALLAPHVKWQGSASSVSDIVPMLDYAFFIATSGVPGPVFLELPLDVLYPEDIIRAQFAERGKKANTGIVDRITNWYIDRRLSHLFNGEGVRSPTAIHPVVPRATSAEITAAIDLLKKATRPVLVIGSQVVTPPTALPPQPPLIHDIAAAVQRLGIPVYLSGMARGLLGRRSAVQYRHNRGVALKEADLVLLCGVPFDFRMGYGQGVRAATAVVSVNRSKEELYKNRTPTVGIVGDVGDFLVRVEQSLRVYSQRLCDWTEWHTQLRQREEKRDHTIDEQALQKGDGTFLNPIHVLKHVEDAIGDDANVVMVADGGDFVGTASYILRPRGPLGWLDPGPFGTLGVGSGFALGVKLARPETEVWLLWGDGSCAYSIMEYDTFVRHNVPVISVVGNDGCWSQIHRDQIKVFHDDVGCVLVRNNYHQIVSALGGHGVHVDGTTPSIDAVLQEARNIAKNGKPVMINAMIGGSDFREGSISV